MNNTIKTRKAYGYHRESGKLYDLGDTVQNALQANMTVKDYEKQLVKANPQLEISFKFELISRKGAREKERQDREALAH